MTFCSKSATIGATAALCLLVSNLVACTSVQLKGYDGVKPIVHTVPKGCPPIGSDYGSFKNTIGEARQSAHTGIDIMAEMGHPIIAVAPGHVIKAVRKGTTGYSINIGHGYDKYGNYVISSYYHNESNLVKKSQIVMRGEQIATVGNTGSNVNRRKTPHLHFEAQIHADGQNFRIMMDSLMDQAAFNPHLFSLSSATGEFVPYDSSVDYGDEPGRFTGFTYPLPCKKN